MARSEAADLAQLPRLLVLDPDLAHYWSVPFEPLTYGKWPEWWEHTAAMLTDEHVRGGCDDPARLTWWVEL